MTMFAVRDKFSLAADPELPVYPTQKNSEGGTSALPNTFFAVLEGLNFFQTVNNLTVTKQIDRKACSF